MALPRHRATRRIQLTARLQIFASIFASFNFTIANNKNNHSNYICKNTAPPKLLTLFYKVFSYENSFYRFINARRRIVQPMIDQSNRAGPTGPYSPDALGAWDGLRSPGDLTTPCFGLPQDPHSEIFHFLAICKALDQSVGFKVFLL